MALVFILLPLLFVAVAAVLLVILFTIDMKYYLLPDKYVFPLGALGLGFHAVQGFALIPPFELFMGLVIGGGMLWIVRYLGTRHYKQEAMGLGDVKLLMSAGLWLGGENVITAIVIGASAGLLHGLIVATARTVIHKKPFSIRQLVIPAGPGFIIGISIVFIYVFGSDMVTLVNAIG